MHQENGTIMLKSHNAKWKWQFSAFLIVCIMWGAPALAQNEGFVPNTGHLDAKVHYFGSSKFVDVFFTRDGVVLDIKDPDRVSFRLDRLQDPDFELPARQGQALYLKFGGANPKASMMPGDVTGGKVNFFFGNDSNKWQSDITVYRTMVYQNLWPNIDVVFSIENGNLVYDVVTRKGASLDQVQFIWDGADEVLPTKEGTDLVTRYGTVMDSGLNNGRSGIISGKSGLGWDESTQPAATKGINALLWSTLIGGSGNDVGSSMAIASNGDIIMAGETDSPDYPGTPGAYQESAGQSIDIFVSRFAAEGSQLVWSTYIGTSSLDYLNAVTLDENDNPIIGGRSMSSNFPTTTGAFQESANGGQDAVVAKLSSDGSTLMYATYIGGSEVDSIFDITTDSNGNVVCAGYTASSDYPTSPGCYQNYFAGPPYDFTVTTLTSDLSTMVASTYIGGTDRDACRGLAIDAAGDLFLAGFSFSTDFPVTAGVFQGTKSTIDDGALVKMSPDLTTLIWATYIGGNASERSLAIDLDSAGDPVICGFTYSSDFPTSTGAFQETHGGSMDIFTAKFNSADGTGQWATYLGGNSSDEALSVMVDASDNPVLGGFSGSSNFPVTDGGYDQSYNGDKDVIVSRLTADGSALLWSSFLGGSDDDVAYEVILDDGDNPVVSGETASIDFPLSTWAYDTSHNGADDAFLIRFDTGDANISLTTGDATIGCGQTTDIALHYTPDLPHTPPLRGYSLRIASVSGLSFSASDITVLSPIGGANDTFQVLENAPGDYTVDFSFLDSGVGLTVEADLLTITVHGTGQGTSTQGIVTGLFRDENNHPFDVDCNSGLDITVDCTPPDTPTMADEPVYTPGDSNTVAWSDESASGALSYKVFASLVPDFATTVSESDWISELTYTFTGLADTLYYYRASARNANDVASVASAAVFSTQDNTPPTTMVATLPALSGSNFDVTYTADDAGSGVENVDLFVSFDSGPWNNYGTFTASPIAFTASLGDGNYAFYSVGHDSIGNSEAPPVGSDTATNVDTSPPDIPTLASEPLFTAGTSNTLSWSDESASGAQTYNIQISTESDFSVIMTESGFIAGLSHEFTGLTDAVKYYYQVEARDELSNLSTYCAPDSSTQDDSAPISSATAPQAINTTTFNVAFSAVDGGIGVEGVELFSNLDGGAFTSYGVFTTSPIAFSAPGATEGNYGFYTVASDSLGNLEAIPAVADTFCILDTTDPWSTVQPLAAYQTNATFTVTTTGSDNLSGISQFELFYSLDSAPFVSFEAKADTSFQFIAPSDGSFEFYTLASDSAGNVEPVPAMSEAVTIVDTNGPTGSFAINAGAIATNDTSVILDIAVTGTLEMRFSNNGVDFPQGWVPFAANYLWTLSTVEGEQTVYGEFRDEADNTSPLTDTIIYDLIPAGAVSFLTLSPGHEAVNVAWHSPDDDDIASIEIWRGLVHDGSGNSVYPDYVSPMVPTPPTDRAAAMASTEWVLAGSASATAEAFIDTVVARGIYHYEIFVIDNAGNSSAAAGLVPRATNYLLGDIAVAYDGDVDVSDLSLLGASYGLQDGHEDFNSDADVGPTHNSSGSGIPQPDDIVEWEDLMILAMNYDTVTKDTGSKSQASSPNVQGSPVNLAWHMSGNRTWHLELTSPAEGLQGLKVAMDLPDGVIPQVTSGALLNNQDHPFFLKNIPAHGLDAGCALIGSGASVNGTGTLLSITMPAEADPGLFNPEDVNLFLRGVDNSSMSYQFSEATPVLIPTVFSMGQNYPNPFNPSTTIQFSLPSDELVRLDVYSLDGRRIATLVNESMTAGFHNVTWLGRDDRGQLAASGMYFYQISAGSWQQVHKMTLMK